MRWTAGLMGIDDVFWTIDLDSISLSLYTYFWHNLCVTSREF